MSFAVFLDVDGVLNTIKTCVASPDGHIGVDDKRIAILAGAIKKVWRCRHCTDIRLEK